MANVGVQTTRSRGPRAATRTVLPLRSGGGAASGVVVVPREAAGKQVTRAEMAQALQGLRALPKGDLALLAKHGIQIHLFPVSGLEDGLLGATSIVRPDGGGTWQPTLVRVAVRSGGHGSESIAEIVQHEVGHVISVLRKQDTSEDAARAYASSH